MKLNIGAGSKPLDGYKSWDIKGGQSAYPLQVSDNSIEEIYASHVLEHFGHKQTAEVLADWFRALKPGGRIRISVPDFDIILAHYTKGDPQWTEGYLLGGQCDENDFHKAIFNERKLTTLLDNAGFDVIRRFESETDDCSSLPISLNIEAVKPPGPRLILPRRVKLRRLTDVHACMTMPRVCWTDTAFVVQPMCARLGISITRSTGVYWDQKITASIVDALNRGPKYILTFDYDSIMDDRDVVALYDIMEAHPDVMALFPQQVRREHDYVMMTTKDGSTKINLSDIEGDCFTVATGHFGCTIIRACVFEKIGKPWFVGVPKTDGTWDDPHTDADVHFWRQMQKANLRTCVAPNVSIGHLENMITWPDKQWRPIYQHVSEYERSGKPKGAI